jgi:hypothetical protein
MTVLANGRLVEAQRDLSNIRQGNFWPDLTRTGRLGEFQRKVGSRTPIAFSTRAGRLVLVWGKVLIAPPWRGTTTTGGTSIASGVRITIV